MALISKSTNQSSSSSKASLSIFFRNIFTPRVNTKVFWAEGLGELFSAKAADHIQTNYLHESREVGNCYGTAAVEHTTHLFQPPAQYWAIIHCHVVTKQVAFSESLPRIA